MSEIMSPFHALRFDLSFEEHGLARGGTPGGAVPLCRGSFSECSGLEANMEAKVINEGGRNYGAAQRVGRVTFGTVVLKRGITSNRDLWRWFELVSQGASAYRLTAVLEIRGPGVSAGGDPQPAARTADGSSEVRWRWQFRHCMPVKFKVPTANASGTEIAIEELHLAHEGLYLVS
jgi:phage tail-like protein